MPPEQRGGREVTGKVDVYANGYFTVPLKLSGGVLALARGLGVSSSIWGEPRTTFSVVDAPRWARAGQDGNGPPDDYQDFYDFMGVMDEIDIDKAKVRVMVSFFGRETPVELDFAQVNKQI